MEVKIKLALPATNESNHQIEHGLDLNDLIVRHPAATYYLQIESGSFEDIPIYAGDILVIDRSITNFHQKLVVAILEGEFVVRKLYIDPHNQTILKGPIGEEILPAEIDFSVWGVVTYIIHKAT